MLSSLTAFLNTYNFATDVTFFDIVAAVTAAAIAIKKRQNRTNETTDNKLTSHFDHYIKTKAKREREKITNLR